MTKTQNNNYSYAVSLLQLAHELRIERFEIQVGDVSVKGNFNTEAKPLLTREQIEKQRAQELDELTYGSA